MREIVHSTIKRYGKLIRRFRGPSVSPGASIGGTTARWISGSPSKADIRHSITSSAVASAVGGIVRPRVFAVLRLMTKSNLVDGRSGMMLTVDKYSRHRSDYGSNRPKREELVLAAKALSTGNKS